MLPAGIVTKKQVSGQVLTGEPVPLAVGKKSHSEDQGHQSVLTAAQ